MTQPKAFENQRSCTLPTKKNSSSTLLSFSLEWQSSIFLAWRTIPRSRWRSAQLFEPLFGRFNLSTHTQSHRNAIRKFSLLSPLPKSIKTKKLQPRTGPGNPNLDYVEPNQNYARLAARTTTYACTGLSLFATSSGSSCPRSSNGCK